MDFFRDALQRTQACRALLATGGLERYWTARGPTVEALALAEANGASLEPGPRALLLSALAFWTGAPSSLRFDELVGLPEAEPICKLTTATIYGPRAIDVWLTRSNETEAFARDEAEVHAGAAYLFDEARSVFAETGDEALNFRAAPDACALGAHRVATYVLWKGIEPVHDDEERNKAVIALILQVLSLSAAAEKENAQRARRRLRRRKPLTKPESE